MFAPGLSKPLSLSLVVVILLAFVTQVDMAPITGWLLSGITAVCGVTAMLYIAEWILDRAVTQFQRVRDALAVTKQSELVDSLSRLNADQISYGRTFAITFDLLPGNAGPVYFMTTSDGSDRIPQSFIAEFVDLSGTEYLYPIRSYSEGSEGRRLASLLTRELCLRGYASPAVGNQPARWSDLNGAIVALGLGE
jgi:hypothetical protein